MNALLIAAALAQWSWTDPPTTAPAAKPARTYASARAEAAANGKPLVVLVSASWCQPCQKLKATLASWPARDDLVFVVVDIDDAPAGVVSGGTVPQLVAWRSVSQPGKRITGYSGQTADQLEKTLLGSTPVRPAQEGRNTPAPAARPWLSVNGSAPGAVHQVTISGHYAIVEPNTEAEWRRHVAEDHGIRAAYTMTPQQLAQAHADAHRTSKGIRRGRR